MSKIYQSYQKDNKKSSRHFFIIYLIIETISVIFEISFSFLFIIYDENSSVYSQQSFIN